MERVLQTYLGHTRINYDNGDRLLVKDGQLLERACRHQAVLEGEKTAATLRKGTPPRCTQLQRTRAGRHAAARAGARCRGQVEAVKVLLQNDADVNAYCTRSLGRVLAEHSRPKVIQDPDSVQ